MGFVNDVRRIADSLNKQCSQMDKLFELHADIKESNRKNYELSKANHEVYVEDVNRRWAVPPKPPEKKPVKKSSK